MQPSPMAILRQSASASCDRNSPKSKWTLCLAHTMKTAKIASTTRPTTSCFFFKDRSRSSTRRSFPVYRAGRRRIRCEAVPAVVRCIKGIAPERQSAASGRPSGLGGDPLARQNATIELVDDARDVEAGFAIRRDAVVLLHRGGAGVVRGQRKREIVMVSSEQLVEIRRAAIHVLPG